MEQNYQFEIMQYSDTSQPFQATIYNQQDNMDDNFFQSIANLDSQNNEQNQFPDPFKRQEFSNEHRKSSQSGELNIRQYSSINKFTLGKQLIDDNDANMSYDFKMDENTQKQLSGNQKKSNLSYKSLNQSYSNDQSYNIQCNESDPGYTEHNKLFVLSTSHDAAQPNRRIPFPGHSSQVQNPYLANKALMQSSYRTGISQQTSTQHDSARHTFDETDGNEILERGSFEKESILQQVANGSQRAIANLQQEHNEKKKSSQYNKDDASEGSIKSCNSSYLQNSLNELAQMQHDGVNIKGNSLSFACLKNKYKLGPQNEPQVLNRSYAEGIDIPGQNNVKTKFLQTQELNNIKHVHESGLQSSHENSTQSNDEDSANKQIITVKLQNIINTNRNTCKAIVYCDQKRYEVRFSENDNAYQVAKDFLERYNLSSKYQTYVQTEIQKVIKLENKKMQKYQYEISKREKHSQYQFQPFNLSAYKPKETKQQDEVLFKMMIHVAGRKQCLAYRQNDTAEQLALHFLHTQQLSKDKYFYQVASQIQENISKYMRIQQSVDLNNSSIQNFKIL